MVVPPIIGSYFRGYLYFQSVLVLGKAKERLIVPQRKTFGFSEDCFVYHFFVKCRSLFWVNKSLFTWEPILTLREIRAVWLGNTRKRDQTIPMFLSVLIYRFFLRVNYTSLPAKLFDDYTDISSKGNIGCFQAPDFLSPTFIERKFVACVQPQPLPTSLKKTRRDFLTGSGGCLEICFLYKDLI